MKITVNNRWINLKDFPIREINKLTKHFSWEVSGAKFSYKFQNGKWDGRDTLIKKSGFGELDYYAPIGILKYLRQEYKDVAEFCDRRLVPVTLPELKFVPPHKLRDYQQIGDLCKKKKRGIFSIAMTGGKTIIGAEIISNIKTLTFYLVPTKILFKQTYDNFQKWFPNTKIGRIGSGIYDPSESINICIVATLWSKMKKQDKGMLDLMNQAGLLIIDEFHHVHTGDSFYKVCQKINAYYRFGMSGTIEKEDIRLLGVAGEVLTEITIKDLQDKGYASELSCIFYKVAGNSYSYTNFVDGKLEGIVRRKRRNKIAIDLAIKNSSKGYKVLMIVERLEHGRILKKAIPNSFFYHGKLKESKKDKALKAFSTGNLNILIGVRKIFAEGVDIAKIDILINMLGGKRILQPVGRILRLGGKKGHKAYFDFIDKYNPTYYKHSYHRINSLMSEGFKVERREYAKN